VKCAPEAITSEKGRQGRVWELVELSPEESARWRHRCGRDARAPSV